MDIITILEAILLGVVEGLTEFIPVSSTGHLILLGDILGFNGPPGKVFEIIIQLGAILAICWLYKEKLFNVAIKFGIDKEANKFVFSILLAFVPAAAFGVLFHDFIKEVLFSPKVVAVSLVLGGFAILLIERKVKHVKYNKLEKIPYITTLLIGLAQTLAMIPGVSRSGATIMGSICLGVERKAATEFSFFLAIPTMLGATVFDVYKNYASFSSDNIAIIAIGFVSAFFAALLVVRKLVEFVGSNGFAPFAWYRIVLGVLMLGLL